MADTGDRIEAQDLRDAQALLDELVPAVSDQESVLSGGKKRGRGANALEGLRESKVIFGNPRDNLIRLDEDLFNKLGIELSEIGRRQMREPFAFYYLTLTTSLQPARGAQFTRLECRLTFGPRGAGEPIVHAIFPTSEWRELLHWEGGMKLGLDGNLGWGVEAALPAELLGRLPANVRASVRGEGEMKGLVSALNFSYNLGRAEVAAYGPGDAECFWRIEKASLQQSQSVQFVIIFKVPRGTDSVQLNGLVAAEPSFQWLAANLKDVFAELAAGIKAIFHREPAARRGRERLPIGDHETWTLKLPG